jgi:predicted ABC-class ATPase
MQARTADELARFLSRIDGRGYKAYKEIGGEWELPGMTLAIDHVQGDPFAAPSRARIRIEASEAGFPDELRRPGARAVGVRCFLARRFAERAREMARSRGSGRSGQVRMEAPGQEVLPCTAVLMEPDGTVEARFRVGLPARGRRVLGRQARDLLLEDVPRITEAALVSRNCEPDRLRLHAEVNEDAEALRVQLRERELVAFVADGAVLPRRSGVDDRPLEGPGVVPFESPPELRIELELPNRGTVKGMGIPRGVTLIVGGGYHGKSTLLNALEQGVYNHRPGDGRELVVTHEDAIKVRAEDGRSVWGVDISTFIEDLPGSVDTRRFTTRDASGSTSQASAIMEALESGASALLIDEDTAATNFMIRDRRMQALVPKEREPITPFIDRVRELFESNGVSSILVLGGSGDYLDVADTVIALNEFRPSDVTSRAREVAAALPTGRQVETPGPMAPPTPRRPLPGGLDPSRGRRSVSVKTRGRDTIVFGTEEIDLSAPSQLVSAAQTRAVAESLLLARNRFVDGNRTLPQVLDGVMDAVSREGLDVLGRGRDGDLALFRRHELAAALNRLRSLALAGDQGKD